MAEEETPPRNVEPSVTEELTVGAALDDADNNKLIVLVEILPASIDDGKIDEEIIMLTIGDAIDVPMIVPIAKPLIENIIELPSIEDVELGEPLLEIKASPITPLLVDSVLTVDFK
jgi:hypothetical protein